MGDEGVVEEQYEGEDEQLGEMEEDDGGEEERVELDGLQVRVALPIGVVHLHFSRCCANIQTKWSTAHSYLYAALWLI
jgi:hypothetical protein